MHKIIFSETALRTFSLYFTRYKQYYIERFSDTGIQDEYLIQQNYHNTADKLVNVIFSSIHTIFSADLIY